jgi:hypothetical protein
MVWTRDDTEKQADGFILAAALEALKDAVRQIAARHGREEAELIANLVKKRSTQGIRNMPLDALAEAIQLGLVELAEGIVTETLRTAVEEAG